MTTKKGPVPLFLLQPRQEYAWAWTKRNELFAQAPLANMPRHVADVAHSERLTSKLDAL